MLQTNTGPWQDPKTVVVVDDHPIVRRGVRAMVEGHTGFEIVGEADCDEDVIKLAEQTCPDIVVMDLSDPRLHGIKLIGEFRRRLPCVEVLVFTQHQSEQLFAQAIDAGARAFICKAERDHLVPALEAVARHEDYFSPTVQEAHKRESSDEVWDWRPLTDREQQIVKLVAEGQSNRNIAHLLKISIKTIETHRAAAMRKTGTNSIAALTLYAARNGMVAL